MTNDTEIRGALEALAGEGSNAALLERRVLAAVRPPASSRSSRLLVAAAAAVVAVVAVAGVGLAYRRHASGPAGVVAGATAAHPCATASTPRFAIPQLGPVADLNATILSATACAGYTQRWLYTSSGGWIAMLTMFAPGVFDASKLADARTVHGSGIDGYILDVPPQGVMPAQCSSRSSAPVVQASCTPVSGLAWEYAPGAFATIAPMITDGAVSTQFFGSDPVAKELAVAAAVQPASPPEMRAPFRLTDLAGLLPLSATEARENDQDNGYGAAAGSVELAVPGVGTDCPAATACEAALTINVGSTVSTSAGAASGNRREIQIGDVRGTIGTDGLTRSLTLRFVKDHWAVVMSAAAAGDVSEETMLRIARNMTFATSTRDTAGWFLLSEALPK